MLKIRYDCHLFLLLNFPGAAISWISLRHCGAAIVSKQKFSCVEQGTEIQCWLKEVKGRAELRTVPTFVTVYTFCASRDTRVSYGWCRRIQGYFCAV